MIPQAHIIQWRQFAPWADDLQVEQDLLISRALIELFNDPTLKETIAFRGGTALYKLYVQPALRYSEDIDLVQIKSEPIGNTLSLIRDCLDPLIGKPKWKLNQGRATLLYRFQTTGNLPAKLKIEINTREHFTVFGYSQIPFSLNSNWFSGETKITTYQFNELMGTKLRALYQRKKGRDLFDLWVALQQTNFSAAKTLQAFQEYMAYENKKITRAMFEKNMAEKLSNKSFLNDIKSVIRPDFEYNPEASVKHVNNEIIALLPGDAWAG